MQYQREALNFLSSFLYSRSQCAAEQLRFNQYYYAWDTLIIIIAPAENESAESLPPPDPVQGIKALPVSISL